MSDEMQIDGKTYISSKRAAVLSTYAQDYIGQLARKSLIDARRVGGLWYISMESLEAYKKKAEEYKPMPPTRVDTTSDPETLVFFDGKEYLSAAKAAEETGYTQDYVGQLARAGTILSRQVGNRWYVQKESIVDHKREKDALLAAVQSQAVGLTKVEKTVTKKPEYLGNTSHFGSLPLLTYHSEDGDLMPNTGKPEPVIVKEANQVPTVISTQTVPIRRVQTPSPHFSQRIRASTPAYKAKTAVKRSYTPFLLASAATIIIVLSIGYASILRQNSVYAANITPTSGMRAAAASAGELFATIGNELEPILTHELVYQRSGSN